MFPNATTSRRIKKMLEEANNSISKPDQNRPISKDVVPVLVAPVAQSRKKKSPFPESVEHKAAKEVTKVSKIF